MRFPARRSPARFSSSAAYTLIEIMLVLSIIAVLVGSAIVLLIGNVDIAKEQRVETDIQAIGTQLKLYQMLNYNFPTTDQGLEALTKKPTVEPLPRKWRQLMSDLPVDPWGKPYIYLFPGKSNPTGYDISSRGPDGTEGTGDDLPRSD